MLRDSTSKVPNVGGIFSVISQVSTGLDIGNGLTSILNHRMGKYSASLGIKKAYRQIKVSHRYSMLRLSTLYWDLENMQDMVIFKIATADFGDSQASLVLRIA